MERNKFFIRITYAQHEIFQSCKDVDKVEKLPVNLKS